MLGLLPTSKEGWKNMSKVSRKARPAEDFGIGDYSRKTLHLTISNLLAIVCSFIIAFKIYIPSDKLLISI